MIEALLDLVDALVLGGAMCFTFLAAEGHRIGKSLFEADQVENCAKLLSSGRRILLPGDLTVLSPGGQFGPFVDFSPLIDKPAESLGIHGHAVRRR